MVLRVRDLTLEEGEKLRRIVRHGQDAIEFKRAQIVLASYQGNTPPRIAVIALASEDYIRGVIRAFNERGRVDLPSSTTTRIPKNRGGHDGLPPVLLTKVRNRHLWSPRTSAVRRTRCLSVAGTG